MTNPSSALIIVLLPAPFGPRRPTAPGGNAALTSRKAKPRPYLTLTRSSWTTEGTTGIRCSSFIKFRRRENVIAQPYGARGVAIELQRPRNHFHRLGRQVVRLEIGRMYEDRVLDVRPGPKTPSDGPAEVIDQHEVIADSSLFVPGDPIEDLDDRADFDCQPGFLEHLARHRRFECFPELDRPPRNAPLAGQRFVLALDDQDAPVLHDHCTHSDERTIGILALVVHASNFSLLGSCSGSVRSSTFECSAFGLWCGALPYETPHEREHEPRSEKCEPHYSPITFTTTRFCRCPSNSA